MIFRQDFDIETDAKKLIVQKKAFIEKSIGVIELSSIFVVVLFAAKNGLFFLVLFFYGFTNFSCHDFMKDQPIKIEDVHEYAI